MIAKIPPRDFGTFSTRLDLDSCSQHEVEPNVKDEGENVR